MCRRLLLVGDKDDLCPFGKEERDEERVKFIVGLGFVHKDEVESTLRQVECSGRTKVC